MKANWNLGFEINLHDKQAEEDESHVQVAVCHGNRVELGPQKEKAADDPKERNLESLEDVEKLVSEDQSCLTAHQRLELRPGCHQKVKLSIAF